MPAAAETNTVSYTQTNWWKYCDSSLQDLMQESMELLALAKIREASGETPYKDYSFVVFPAAKAYEGYLKKLFLDMDLISVNQYFGEHFRIGRALSPTLPKRYRAGWVYGKLTDYCNGEKLPMKMWDVWKRARNRVFHYFPDKHEVISLAQAENLVAEITRIMEEALEGCDF